MTTKLKRYISLSITAEESDIVDKLKLKGINVVAVFRRGIKEYQKECELVIDKW